MEKFILWAMLLIMAGFGYVESITGSGYQCSQAENSTVNTVYQANVRNLLDSLVTNAPLQDGFFNTSVGDGSDQVYGLGWCRADVSPEACSECLSSSISKPLEDCPDRKDMAIWTSLCNLRYSNKSFFGKRWTNSSSATYGVKRLDDPSVFSQGFSMMESIAKNVSSQPLMFGTGAINVGENGGRYGMGQCSRDLSKSECENCLEGLLTNYHTYVLNQTAWEMQGVSCGMWYDDVRFYDNNATLTPTPNSTLTPTPNSGLTPTPDTSEGGKIWYKGDVILALEPSFFVLVLRNKAILGLLLGSLDYNNFEKNELRDEKQKLKIDIERLEQQLKSTFCGPSTTSLSSLPLCNTFVFDSGNNLARMLQLQRWRFGTKESEHGLVLSWLAIDAVKQRAI
ncbi:cysteine-rich repeat secretory protein 38-like protein [Tanacetum coccineum]